MRNTLKILKDRKGNMYPLAVAVVLSMLMLVMVVSEYMNLMITASGVKDAFESAIIAVVNDNYNEVYHCVREGYAGGYEPNGGSGFHVSLDKGDVQGRLTNLLGLKWEEEALIRRTTEGKTEYRITWMDVQLKNALIRKGGGVFAAEGEMDLKVPVYFGGNMLLEIPIRLKVRAALKERF